MYKGGKKLFQINTPEQEQKTTDYQNMIPKDYYSIFIVKIATMPEDTLFLFRKFPNATDARDVSQVLQEQGIAAVLKKSAPDFDAAFAFNPTDTSYDVYIPAESIDQAETIFNQLAQEAIQDIDKSYYLYQFSKEQLMDILIHKDQWSNLDYILARDILKERGENIDEVYIRYRQEQYIRELEQPDKMNFIWIFIGYLSLLLGGILGAVIGYSIYNSRKTLPNGRKVFTYSQADRAIGKTLFVVATIVMLAFIAWGLHRSLSGL